MILNYHNYFTKEIEFVESLPFGNISNGKTFSYCLIAVNVAKLLRQAAVSIITGRRNRVT